MVTMIIVLQLNDDFGEPCTMVQTMSIMQISQQLCQVDRTQVREIGSYIS